MSLSNQYVISAKRIKDKVDFKTWKTASGIALSGTPTTTRDGYGMTPVVLGGPVPLESPISCSRTFYPATDGTEKADLYAGVMKDWFALTIQKTDADGNAFGSPETKNALLTGFSETDKDVSADTPAVDEYTAVFQPGAMPS